MMLKQWQYKDINKEKSTNNYTVSHEKFINSRITLYHHDNTLCQTTIKVYIIF